MQEALDGIIQDFSSDEGNLISVLQQIQEEYGYLPEDAIAYVSQKTKVPPSKFFGIATFYAQFYLKPRGKNIITVCCGTACHVKGSAELIDLVGHEFNIPRHEDTSEDMACSLEKVACVGACSIAPVTIINKKVHGKVSRDKLLKEIALIKEEKDEEKD